MKKIIIIKIEQINNFFNSIISLNIKNHILIKEVINITIQIKFNIKTLQKISLRMIKSQCFCSTCTSRNRFYELLMKAFDYEMPLKSGRIRIVEISAEQQTFFMKLVSS